MKRILLLAVALVALVASPASAEVTIVAIGGKAPSTFKATCPDGICPVAKAAPLTVRDSGGAHWSYPGEIRSHLISTHGYTAEQLAGLTRGQLETLHDDTHTGRSVAYDVSDGGPLKGKLPSVLRGEREPLRGIFERKPVRGRLRCFGGRCG